MGTVRLGTAMSSRNTVGSAAPPNRCRTGRCVLRLNTPIAFGRMVTTTQVAPATGRTGAAPSMENTALEDVLPNRCRTEQPAVRMATTVIGMRMTSIRTVVAMATLGAATSTNMRNLTTARFPH
mmetsp:Transcript_4163/g.5702  ORF Transcript_4163/g.5702 Transcript_4163/m.5702 type:complete len:124 (-) Transcript_4163:79-450(-)